MLTLFQNVYTNLPQSSAKKIIPSKMKIKNFLIYKYMIFDTSYQVLKMHNPTILVLGNVS